MYHASYDSKIILMLTLIILLCSIRTDRYCKQTTIINGVTIPKGAVIDVPISMLHHSPLYWKDPEKFDPNRFIPTHRLSPGQSILLDAGIDGCNYIS